ncbi:MAG: phycobilisome linker polypeptide [Leptolyngbyaceae bacterium]|nr:phycobilisome linker polypeptide [Leptolyngbyaceae bacterium]
MLGQYIGKSSNTPSGSRCFRYEVTGLRQSTDTDSMSYPIRSSASTFMTVPYDRMNEMMQRITAMGGTIVNIEPINSGEPTGSDA